METLICNTVVNTVLRIIINSFTSQNARCLSQCRQKLPVAQNQNRYRSPLIAKPPANLSNSKMKKSIPLFVARPHQINSVPYSTSRPQHLDPVNLVFIVHAVGNRKPTLHFIRPYSTTDNTTGYLFSRLTLSYCSSIITSETQTPVSYKATLTSVVYFNYRRLIPALITFKNR